MGILKSFFNHKREVKMRIEQLEALNKIIDSRTSEVSRLNDEVNDLKMRVAEIRAKYPLLDEEEAIREYYNSLLDENERLEIENFGLTLDLASKNREMSELAIKLGLLLDMDNTHKAKKELIRERAYLEEYSKSHIKVEDILFVAYPISYDLSSIIVAPFIFKEDVELSDSESHLGKIYISVDKSRTVGFCNNFAESFSRKLKKRFLVNTDPCLWFHYADICVTVGDDSYLNGFVSLHQINKVLNDYMANYKVLCNDVGDIVVRKRKNKNLE